MSHKITTTGLVVTAAVCRSTQVGTESPHICNTVAPFTALPLGSTCYDGRQRPDNGVLSP